MYGDTSELHFLQTTKSSGPLATPSILRARKGPPDRVVYSGTVAAAISRTTSLRSWLAW